MDYLVDIPNDYLCPITLQLMENPAITTDGNSYERVAIIKWFETGHNTSPLTGAIL